MVSLKYHAKKLLLKWFLGHVFTMTEHLLGDVASRTRYLHAIWRFNTFSVHDKIINGLIYSNLTLNENQLCNDDIDSFISLVLYKCIKLLHRAFQFMPRKWLNV